MPERVGKRGPYSRRMGSNKIEELTPCHLKKKKLSSAGIPKKFRAVETSTSLRSSSPSTSLTIHPSQTALPIATAHEAYTARCVLHSPISTQISIGRPPMGSL